MSVTLRPEVLAFAEAMELKLQKHDEKRGTSWKTSTPQSLFEHLKAEVIELQEELKEYNEPHTILWGSGTLGECVDIANMAMMVADVCDELHY